MHALRCQNGSFSIFKSIVINQYQLIFIYHQSKAKYIGYRWNSVVFLNKSFFHACQKKSVKKK